MQGRRILVLIPHPDDEVVGCCAAILRARQSGSVVFGVYLTTGVPAPQVSWPWARKGHPQRVATRCEEAAQVAAVLGLEPLFFHDVPARKLRHVLAPVHDLILQHARRVQADTLWVPAYEGGHQDHDSANFLASTLQSEFSVREFSEYNYFGGRIHSQQFPVANGAEQGIRLTSDEQQLKKKALALYPSERGNLTYVRCQQEVFRPLTAYDYNRPPHPGKLFYQRYQWVPAHPRVDYTQPQDVCRSLQAFAEKLPNPARPDSQS